MQSPRYANREQSCPLAKMLGAKARTGYENSYISKGTICVSYVKQRTKGLRPDQMAKSSTDKVYFTNQYIKCDVDA